MIYLAVGDIPFLQDRALARIRKEQGGRQPDSFFGPELNVKSLQEVCCNLSLLGDTPFIIVRSAERIAKKSQTLLLDFLPAVPDDVCLVFVAEKIDKRLKFWQRLVKLAELISCEAPPPRERRQWLEKEARRRGLEVAADARSILIEVGQADFSQALLLLDKLAIYLGDSKRVDREAIEACCIGGSPVKIFEWADAVGAADWKKALMILQGLWINQEAPLAVLALLVRHYRILLRAVENRALWGRPQEMARVLGVPPFTVDRYLQQARHYRREDLIGLWQELQSCDRQLKSSPGKKELEVEKLFLNIRRLRKAS